jgi:hypothetical protein
MIAAGNAPYYIATRAKKADLNRALEILEKAGKDNPPMAGDEMPVPRTRRRRIIGGKTGKADLRK